MREMHLHLHLHLQLHIRMLTKTIYLEIDRI